MHMDDRRLTGKTHRFIYKKKNNKGFTLVEMIVTIVVMTIMVSLSVFGLLKWQDWSNFKRENEYAQILYIAAQNQLAEFSADGRLSEMQESLSGKQDDDLDISGKVYSAVGLNITDSISQITDSEGNTYTLENLFPESAGKETESLYQDEIVSLRAETGEYLKYLDNPEEMKKNNPEAYWVFELLGSYVYDTSILNGSTAKDGSGSGAAICVEMTPADGQVFSVLYSDRNDKFIYQNITGDKNGNEEGKRIADISNRTESYRKERMVGYFGVDTLYAATKNELVQPELSGVKLYNKDTFYMTYRLTAKYRAFTSQLTYIIDLDASKNVNDKKLTIKLDGTKLKNKDNAEEIECDVIRYDNGSETKLGRFPILAWVEKDQTVHVVLDAADIQATADLYGREIDEICSSDEQKVSETKFSNTYSFFRFGVDVDNVYASVTAGGEGFTNSRIVSNFGNFNIWKNQGAKHTAFAGESSRNTGDGTEMVYSVTNARHLYNIRYIEELSYEKENVLVRAEDGIAGVEFVLKENIDWATFEQNGELYDSYQNTGNIKLSSLNTALGRNVSRFNCDFPSITQIRQRDVLDGNNKTVSGISVSEVSNALYGAYYTDDRGEQVLADNRPVGFVNVNYGSIENLRLDNIAVNGADFVGGFCGINAGKAYNLETRNTGGTSFVSGRKHVGGIMGFQIPDSQDSKIEELTNRAGVRGVEEVGGIVGMLRNDFDLSGMDIAELDGLSDWQAGMITGNDTDITITVSNCKNYGEIAGVNSSELKGIYAAGYSLRITSSDDVTKPRYIGGIAGYCYNSDNNDTSRITIEKCVSSPQYDESELLTILADSSALSQYLKGAYVGGIVGYNYFGHIIENSTKSESGRQGYILGYRYVGGIVGFNIGPASGIVGSDTSSQGENNNHVIAYEFAGGITGCNSDVLDNDSEGNDISGRGAKDPERLEGLLLPDPDKNLNVKIDNWVNRGIVIAVNEYSGGITGYNSGYIYRCNSIVKEGTADTHFASIYSGNYCGGIAGYNNGIIGNTQRNISDDGKTSSIVNEGTLFSTVCYVKGHSYVGGIVGYNDVNSIVEDYGIAGGYVCGDEGSCYVGGYAGFNASADLLMSVSEGGDGRARFIQSNPNLVSGSYFVGGIIGGNIINMADNDEINRIDCVFKTDNFLGILEGKEFVGGFIGYNLLIENDDNTTWVRNDSDSSRGAVYILQKKLAEEFEKSDDAAENTEESLTDKKNILDNLSESLGIEIAGASQGSMYVSGQGPESTKVSFGTISGSIYVGGVFGYNDKNTSVTVHNVENATPIEATASIKCEEEQSGRSTDYAGNDMGFLYSYAGGIVGKVSKNTVLDNCWNASNGTVTSGGTYTGGLCEVNEGIIEECVVSNFGKGSDDYVGGLCGLNKSLITKCKAEKRAVSGRNVVGFITAENFGTISDISLNHAFMIVSGKSAVYGEKDGVSGFWAGYNGKGGRIILSDDIANISIYSEGRYVGAVAGINDGIVENDRQQTSGTPDNIVISGTISGNSIVGGLLGLNRSSERTIEHYTNKASVTARNGGAGGIIGDNRSTQAIRYCANDGVVNAPDAGNAGGITSINNGRIEKCFNYSEVTAPGGMCGGITSVNEDDGEIYNCFVGTENDNQKITFRSTKSVGVVAAQNGGIISGINIRNVNVTNETTVISTNMGVVAGENFDGGEIRLNSNDRIENCTIVIQSNYCNAGGIAGVNKGMIHGTSANDGRLLAIVSCNIIMENADVSSIGGVAGSNTGTIDSVAVNSEIQGILGSAASGYGGIAGYSGYPYESSIKEDDPYPALIQNCTFDGIINASGSSGAPVRVGGIVGINGYGSRVENCFIGVMDNDSTYVTAGDYENKTSESVDKTDARSYSYTGGIAGENYGWISACDNAAKSTDNVHIIAFAGETGGITGYNHARGTVSGYADSNGTEHYLTTGEKWSIDQRCCENDHGPGGIIGKSVSAEKMSYIINNADVYCNYKSNSYAGGLIGVLGQQYEQKTEFYKCENYGDVECYRNAGGLIGMLESNGAVFDSCKNWGTIHAVTLSSGGFIATHYSYVVGTDFRHCKNHGKIINDGTGGSVYAGGFIGREHESGNSSIKSYLYDCVNTGIIQSKATCSGSYFGLIMNNQVMELCRNYNVYDSSKGIAGRSQNWGKVIAVNCLSDSGRAENTGFYYLDSDSKEQFASGGDVYFSFHEGPCGDFKYNGKTYRSQLKDPAYLFSTPDTSNKFELYTSWGGKYSQLNINMDYAESSKGLDSFVVYFWNGNSNYLSAPKNTYYCTATFLYSDGTEETSGQQTATGYFDVDKDRSESKLVFQNPRDDKYPVMIKIRFDNNKTYLRGFSYIPADGSGLETACTYLSEKYDTTFNISRISKTSSSGTTTKISDFHVDKKPTTALPSDVWYCFPNDTMDIEWTAYSNYRVQCSSSEWADITFDVNNGSNASGMDAFVFDLSNDNTSASTVASQIKTFCYEYTVTFTDKNGNSVTTDLKSAEGFDSGEENFREKSRQIVNVSEGLDSIITSVTLHIRASGYRLADGKTGTGTDGVHFRGFGWIPKGEGIVKKMAAGYGSAGEYFYDMIKDTNHLKVNNNGDGTYYVYIPMYRYGVYDMGFSMVNDPIGDKYYTDTEEYYESESLVGQDGRIETYKDIDPKFASLLEDVLTVEKKLDEPTSLQMTDSSSHLVFKWNSVKNAFGYQVYYKIVDADNRDVFTSDTDTIGSLQTEYTVKIDNDWKENDYSIIFSVRALNAYHFANDESDIYDSNWASLNSMITKKALPKPEVHLEIVSGNRTTFVLDNYDEYVRNGCTDCTINVNFNGSNYSWNVEEDGAYRVPEYVKGSPGSPVGFKYYAQPNDSLKDTYTTSDVHYQRGEGHGNETLEKSSWYCKINMKGFYGTVADSMEYMIEFVLPAGKDTYVMTDITAYDDEVGATVVYDSEITHVANSYSGGGTLKLNSTLKNIPEKWFGEDNVPKVTVRAYPYRSQFDIIHYGHDVAENVVLSKTADENKAKLAEIYDSSYIGEGDDAPADNCIWDYEKDDLKDGYLLLKQEDGTYDIIYNSLIEMSKTAAKERRESYNEPYTEYYRYDVFYRIYSDMSAETDGKIAVNSSDFHESYWGRELPNGNNNRYDNTRTDSNDIVYVQEIQPVPIVEDTVIVGTDESGRNEYRFKWDTFYQDVTCWNTGNKRYQSSEMKYLTNPDAGLFSTWDAYLANFEKAGFTNTEVSSGNGTARNYMRKLMNAYYDGYSTASYRVDLIGTTIDGKEVVLDSVGVDSPTSLGTLGSIPAEDGTDRNLTTHDGVTLTKYNVWDYECTFTDYNNTWSNYTKISARVMRLGSLSSVKAYSDNNGKSRTSPYGATYILPRYTEKSIALKLAMSTISKPEISLLKVDGKYITNDLIYEVSWGAITDDRQKKDLGGYLITATTAGSDGEEGARTHYYYVEAPYDPDDTIGLDLIGLEQNGTVTNVTGAYTATGDKCSTRINLSDFNSGDMVAVSVKAVARTNSESYRDGGDGITTEIEIPERIAVPKAESLSVVPSDDGQSVDMDTYKAGYSIQYGVNDYPGENSVSIVMAAAVFDEGPDIPDDDASYAKDDWNEGAVMTLYSEEAPCSLGNAADGEAVPLRLTDFERYPGEFAGKWIKIVLQARSDTRIDSLWSDMDTAGMTVNYVWVHIPEVILNDVDLTVSAPDGEDETDSDGGVIRYLYDGKLYNESQDSEHEIRIASKTLRFTEDRNADGYHITITGITSGTDENKHVYHIYLQRHMENVQDAMVFDGTWDVYLAGALTDIATAQDEEYRGATCSQDEAAVWIGRIGAEFATEDGTGEDTVNTIIDIPDISICSETLPGDIAITAQLRYVKDEGGLLIVLPDVEQIGETACGPEENNDTEQVLVCQYLTEEAAYTAGKAALYKKTKDESDGMWKDEIQSLDMEAVKRWYEELESEENGSD